VVFHGSYRPSLDVDVNGVFVRDPSKYTIDIIQDVSVSIPANQIISEVTYGGTAIPLASLNGGNGYEINNDVVSLVGTARPTGDDASGSQLRVNYFSNPGEITLDTEQGNTIPQEILDFMPHLLSGTRKEDIRVYLGADKATAVTNGALTLDQFTYVGNKVTVNWDKVTLPGANTKVFVDYDVYPPNRADDNVFALQVGVSQAESDTLHLTIQAYENLILDLYSLPVPDVNNLDQWESRIQKAIEFSMKQGVSIGATSNRLEFAMESLMVTNENTVEAKSRIVDADYAVESAQLARNQLLQQAGTAMLAQANASSVSVLSLLR
jgi:flagellin-like hook-associated protein FlgL